MIIVMTRLPATQCVPCKLVNAGPDELRGTYLLDMVLVLGAFIIIMFMFHHHAFSLQSSSLFQYLQHHHCVQRKIFILQVVSFFIFHLFLPFESVTFIFLDSWHSMMFLLSRATQSRQETTAKTAASTSIPLIWVLIPADSRREEDEQIFCFASGGFPVESCPADQIWTNKLCTASPIFVPATLALRRLGIDKTLTHNYSWRPETVWPY